MGREKTLEKRKDRRYKAIDGAYVAISPNSNKLGQITDISMGGLCFKYFDTSKGDQNSGTQQEESIFLSSMGYYVGDLPFKTISDYEVTNEPSFSLIKVRKRHVQFTGLSFKQLFDLDYYLRKNVSEQMEKLPQQYKSKTVLTV